MLRKLSAFCIAVIITLLLAGCWDKTEPDEQVYTLSLGFDMDDEGNYRCIAQFSNPTASALGGGAMGGPGGGASGQAPYWVYISKGRTPYEAVRNLAPVSTRIVNISHTGVILLSERLARHGIGPIADLIIRNPSLRLSMLWAVVDGDIDEILKARLPGEQAPATGLVRVLMPTRLADPAVGTADIREGINRMLSPGFELLLARLEVTEDDRNGSGDGGGNAQLAPMPPMRYIGGAVFKGDKMVGWVDGRAAIGLNIVAGIRQRGAFLVKAPEGEGFVSIEMSRVESRMRPEVKGDEIRVRIDISARGHMSDQALADGKVLDLSDPKIIDSLRDRYSEVISNHLKTAIEQARELGSDVFGFGNLIYRKRPKIWNRISDKWDEMFLTIPVDIYVKGEVVDTGLAISPPLDVQSPR